MKHRGSLWVKSSVLVATMIWSTAASASDLALLVGAFKDLWYDDAKMTRDVATIVEKTAPQFASISQYTEDQFDDFKTWMKNNMADGELDIIWLNGSMPHFMWPEGKPVSMAQQWLEAGNMFINVGQTFADQSWECGGAGCEVNGIGAATNILGLAGEIFVSINAVRGEGGANVVLKKTDAGIEYLPSMCARPPSSIVFQIADIVGDWEVGDSFATLTGDNPGEYADPCVIHNKKTNGYLCILSQSGGDLWCSRGGPTADFINNWVTKNAIGFGVEPAGKLVTRWAELKSGS